RLADTGRNNKAAIIEYLAQVGQHGRAAAHHDAVGFRIERGQPDVLGQLAAFDYRGKPAAIAERLARNRRVVNELLAHDVAKILVVGQLVLDVVGIGQFADKAYAVQKHYLLEAFIYFGIFD